MMRRVLLVALLALAVSVPLWTAAAHSDRDALMEAVASDEFVDAELVAFVDVDSAADSAADVSVMVDATASAAVEAELVQTPAKAKAAKAKKPAKAKKAAKAPKAKKAAKAAKTPKAAKAPKVAKAKAAKKATKAPKAAKAAKAAKPAKATKTKAAKAKTTKTAKSAAAKTSKSTKAAKAKTTTTKAKTTKTATKAAKTASKAATPAKAAKKTSKAAKPAKAAATKAKTTTKAKTKTTKTSAKTAKKAKAKTATSTATAAAAKKLKATASKAAAKESLAQKQSAEALEADMSEEGMRAKFAIFKAKRKKPYFSAATEAQAYRTFKKNRMRIHEMNNKFGKKGKQKLFHSAGPFADIEPEEFKKKFRTIRPRTGAAPEPTAVPAKTVVRKGSGSSKSPASKLKARKQSLLQLETEAEADEHALSMMEVGFGTATEAEVGNACTTGARGPKGVLMQGGSVRKCAMEQGWPAAAFDPSRPHGWSWCCVPAKPAEVEAQCAARGVCMPNTAGTAADGCAAVGGVFDTKHSGYCPENSGGPATAEGNRCCVKDGSFKPTPAPAPKPTPTPTPAKPASGLVYEVDYRFSTGKTTPVKHQGQCGSCWAHAAIQGLESALLFAGKPSPLLSAQAIMDCRPWKAGGGDSCVGGWYEDAFKHWQKNRAVTQDQYPYLAKEQKCAAPAGAGALVKSWGYATPKCSGACPRQDEEQLLVSLKNYGPLSIYLDAASFQHYKGGILPASSCSSNTKDMDHAVQIVGYGTDEGNKFWLLRNSWGEKWGEAGYVRAEFGTNTCGLANTAAFITV